MSDAPAPKKAETASKKAESASPAATKTDGAKSEAAASGTTAPESSGADSSASKASSGPKSASQSSICHFSSVSTPQYRSGWNAIFGGAGNSKSTKTEDEPSHNTNENEPLSKLTLNDADITAELRALLDEAFRLEAERNGVDMNDMQLKSKFMYTIDCDLS